MTDEFWSNVIAYTAGISVVVGTVLAMHFLGPVIGLGVGIVLVITSVFTTAYFESRQVDSQKT